MILYFDEIINKKLSREISLQKKETKFLECKFDRLNQTIEIDKLKKNIDNNLKQYLEKKYSRTKALNYFQYIYLNGEDDDSSVDEENAGDKRGQLYFYYFVFPKLLNDGIFYNEKYKCKNDKLNINKYIWSYLDYSIPSKQSNKLYEIFEEVSSNIIDNEDINKNYKLYDYSLNPTSNFHFVNKYLIKILWFIYFSKTFKSIPFIKKRYYFEIIMNYFKKNIDIIEERAMLILFNSINKNGDRDMNQIFYPYMKNKTYTSYLCVREKVKSENNFMKYTMNIENDKNNNNNIDNNNLNSILKHQKNEARKNNEETDNIYKEKKLLSFEVNSFCRAEIGGNKNICGEPYTEDINELYCEDKFISFKCQKCGKEQNLLISCKLGPDQKDEKFDINYTINFELLSPLELLRQNWLKYPEIDPCYISENYLQCYLSAIFYFYSQNLPCNFLIPDYGLKSELREVKNNYYSIVNDEEFFDENKIKKVVVKNKEKDEGYESNIIIFEEDDDESQRGSLTFRINEKKDGLINSSDKLIQLRDTFNKKELKSSLKKNKNDFGAIQKKKTVEFKLNLQKLNLNGDS